MKKRLINYIFLFVFFLFSIPLNGQQIEIGATLGFTSYQGDINPLASRLSLQGAQLVKGMSLGYRFNRSLGVKFQILDTHLEAYDNSSFSSSRVKRNLHFRTDLKEAGIIFDYEFLNLIPWFRKKFIHPYVTAGVAAFSFNPTAKHKGVWYDLQPLGTEGQGLPNSNKEKYNLTQFSFPIGVGLRYHHDSQISIAFEIAPRITTTDYLDDVSGSYPDLEQLREVNGDIAVHLSYKGYEGPQQPTDLSDVSYTGRGNPSENDWYVAASLTLAYRFSTKMLSSKYRKAYYSSRCRLL